MMSHAPNAVQDWIAQVHIGARHINFSPQHSAAVVEKSCSHLSKKPQIGIDISIPIGAVLTGLSQCAPVSSGFIGAKITDIRQAFFDQYTGPVIERIEVARGKTDLSGPLKPKPADILLNRVNVLVTLFFGVGIVETQMAATIKTLCQAEVKTDGFRVSDVKKPVRLWRESSHHFGNPTFFKIVHH